MQVRYRKQALKALRRMHRLRAHRIRKAMLSIASTGWQSHDVRKLRGRDGYRYRSGSCRVIFSIRDDVLEVRRVSPRGDAYK